MPKHIAEWSIECRTCSAVRPRDQYASSPRKREIIARSRYRVSVETLKSPRRQSAIAVVYDRPSAIAGHLRSRLRRVLHQLLQATERLVPRPRDLVQAAARLCQRLWL